MPDVGPMPTTGLPDVPDTIPHGSQNFYRAVVAQRGLLKHVARCVVTLLTLSDKATTKEAAANLEFAFRHIEDASMRMGKVLQALDGGVSVYDRRTTTDSRPEAPRGGAEPEAAMIAYFDGGPKGVTDLPFASTFDRRGNLRQPGYVDSEAIGVYHPPFQPLPARLLALASSVGP